MTTETAVGDKGKPAPQRRDTYNGAAGTSATGYSSAKGRPGSLNSTGNRPQKTQPNTGLSRPQSGVSTLYYSGEDDLDQLRQKYVLLEGDRRAYYETSQWTLKQNQETVHRLKKENKELKRQLSEVNSQRGALEPPANKDIRALEKKVHELRATHDRLVADRTRGSEKLMRLKESLQALEKDKQSLLAVDSPELRTIRSLENRLDKALVKHNEASSLSRTYAGIAERLRDERATFDSQLRAVEESLRAKGSDLEQLAAMSAEAQQAKEAAMADLRAAEAALARERERRSRELAERREQAEAAEAKRAGGDPAELERCRAAAASYDEAFREVQEATGVVDLAEFVDRFLSQEAVREDLKVRPDRGRWLLREGSLSPLGGERVAGRGAPSAIFSPSPFTALLRAPFSLREG
uniref:Axonemal dynein intermediate chain protein n=1 Tax=Tetraselmis sp. GSL018 TaxID=582737 RepID=A0A061RB48_9CHLO|mmetsp:Transcript_14306/g.33876  ORF Transcript_14306/g.33876 Transcript_14306/m.33876 type:complete len:409 (-) Transcript_14306:146-1372(-)